jgi:hypothetical protein
VTLQTLLEFGQPSAANPRKCGGLCSLNRSLTLPGRAEKSKFLHKCDTYDETSRRFELCKDWRKFPSARLRYYKFSFSKLFKLSAKTLLTVFSDMLKGLAIKDFSIV